MWELGNKKWARKIYLKPRKLLKNEVRIWTGGLSLYPATRWQYI